LHRLTCLASWQNTKHVKCSVSKKLNALLNTQSKGCGKLKRYGNIYSKICTLENLRNAHKNARKGKLFYKEVRMVDSNSDYYLKQVQKMLVDKTYQTSKYEVFTKAEKGKIREIYKLPYFPDRIVHWAIMLQIEDIFMKYFIRDTFAALPNRGIHDSLNRLQGFLKDESKTQYCLKLDIKKFFPNVDHQILKAQLHTKFKDRELMWLLEEIIDSIPGEKNIPIGNYLSQYIANFYLTKFDHWIKETVGIKYYLRYMDDIVILHSSKEYLHALLRSISQYLEVELRLQVKENWQVFPTRVRGIDFVGYRSFGRYTLLRKSTSQQFKLKMRRLRNIEKLSFKDFCCIHSYLGWLKCANCYNLETTYIKPLISKIQEYRKENVKCR